MREFDDAMREEREAKKEKSFEELWRSKTGQIYTFNVLFDHSEKVIKAADAKIAEQAEEIKALKQKIGGLGLTMASMQGRHKHRKVELGIANKRIKELEAELAGSKEDMDFVGAAVKGTYNNLKSLVDRVNQSQSPWLPASSPPAEDALYWVMVEREGASQPFPDDARWFPDKGLWATGRLGETVIAWMPIPEYTPAPVEENQEEDL